MKKQMKKQMWIGIFDVTTKDEKLLPGSAGAFVNVLGQAIDENNFIEQAKLALKEEGFDVVSYEDVMPYAECIEKTNVDDEIRKYAQIARESGAYQFATFHSFAADDEEDDDDYESEYK